MARSGGVESAQRRSCANPLEEAPAEPALDALDDAGERGLGHGQPVGGQGDGARLGDGEEARDVALLVEHCAVPYGNGAAGRMSCSLAFGATAPVI